MVISLIHPSRGRPEKAAITANNWIRYAGGVATEHIFSIDKSDPAKFRYKEFDKMIVNDNQSVVEATNHAAKIAKGDILLYLSDDFDCFENWGERIREIASKYEGEYMIKVNDGLQKFEAEVLTIPIMSKALYHKLGYFFHPEYMSMWVDVDLYYTCERLGVIKRHREITFQHNHYSVGRSKRDETNVRSDGFWEQGKQVLAKRRRVGFCV